MGKWAKIRFETSSMHQPLSMRTALHWCTLQKVWFHSYWKSCFRSFQKGLLPASYSKSWLFLDVFSLKRSTFLPSWAGQHQGLSRRPSFPVAGSFSQWEPRHSLCVVHNGLATHTPEPSTDSQVSHCSIHFCQIEPYMILLSDCVISTARCSSWTRLLSRIQSNHPSIHPSIHL